METSREWAKASTRVLLAVLAIGGILSVAGRSLAPNTPTATWLFWCAMVGGALAVAVVACLVVGLHARQAMLRKGGTDAQWFAFTSEPEGLVTLRGPSWSNSGHEACSRATSSGGRHGR